MCHGLSATKLDTFFARVADARTRGHTFKLKKNYCGTEARYHFFSNRVVNRWNQLEPEDVEVTTVNTFKNHLQKIKNTRMDFFMD